METLASHGVNLLERLHMKRLVGSSVVTEEATIPNPPSQSESSMDFAVNPSGMGTTMPVVPYRTKTIVTAESDSGNPPIFFSQSCVKGLFL